MNDQLDELDEEFTRNLCALMRLYANVETGDNDSDNAIDEYDRRLQVLRTIRDTFTLAPQVPAKDYAGIVTCAESVRDSLCRALQEENDQRIAVERA